MNTFQLTTQQKCCYWLLAKQLRKVCISFIVERRSAVSKQARWSEVLATINVIQDIYEATVEKYEAATTGSKLWVSHVPTSTPGTCTFQMNYR